MTDKYADPKESPHQAILKPWIPLRGWSLALTLAQRSQEVVLSPNHLVKKLSLHPSDEALNRSRRSLLDHAIAPSTAIHTGSTVKLLETHPQVDAHSQTNPQIC